MTTNAPSSNPLNRRSVLLVPFVLVFVYALQLRVDEIFSRSLEYDEIWTLLHYSGTSYWDALTDLSAPNNHTLHSVLVKVCIDLFGTAFWAIRLPALLAGLACMVVVAYAAYSFTGSKWAALLALGLIGFDPMLIHYGKTARGYSLQCLLLSVLALLMLRYYAKGRLKRPIVFHAALVLVPIMAVVLLATSAFYLAIMFGAFFVALWLRNEDDGAAKQSLKRFVGIHKALLVSTVIATVGSIAWVLWHYADLQSARDQFGVTVSGVPGLLSFISSRCTQVDATPWLVVLLFLAFFPKSRGVAVVGIGVALFPMLLAVAVSGGPARVYQPSLVMLYLSVCLGAQRFFLSLPSVSRKHNVFAYASVVALAVLGAVASSRVESQMPPDWQRLFPRICKRFGPDTYVALPSGAGFEVAYDQLMDTVVTVSNRVADNRGGLVQIGYQGALDGMNVKTGEQVQIPVEDRFQFESGVIERVPYTKYELVPLTPENRVSGAFLFFRIQKMNHGEYKNFMKQMELSGNDGDWHIFNGFVAKPLQSLASGEVVISTILFSNTSTLSYEHLFDIQKMSKSRISVYTLRSVAQ